MITRKRQLALSFMFCSALVPSFAHAARGGPDGLGWSWADSDEAGIDTSFETPSIMNPIAASLPDDGVFAIPIAFPFTLYGQTSSTLYFSTNGWISLRDPGGFSAPLNTDLPDPSPPNATIAYLWDDHADGAAGSFAQHGPTPNGHLFFIRHIAKGSGAISQFYIQFYDNNSVKVVYVNRPELPSATVGIEAELGGVGLRVAFNGAITAGANFRDDYAILFFPRSPLDCSAATEVLCPTPVNGTTLGGAATIGDYGCDAIARAGAERVYSFQQLRAGRFQASLSNLGGRDLVLYVVGASCHAGIECRAGGAATIDIPDLPVGSYYLVVDGTSPLDDGSFTLVVQPGDRDCNENGVGDTCDILAGTSTDCNADGRPDDCGHCEVDIVFMMDTSGSMVPYFTPLCDAIAATVTTLATEGIDFIAQAWGITQTSSCLTDNVRNRLGATVPGSPTPPLDQLTGSESWAQAASIVAGLYPWTPNAIRVVVPIGDEGPFNGTPVNDPGDDRDAVTHAISVCLANQVIASPITPNISNPANDLLAQDLAAGTGGTWSSTGTSMGDVVVALARDACTVFTPLADAGPDVDICTPANVRLDGSGSVPRCASGTEYRWLDGTNELCGGWSGTPICDVTPVATTVYTLEVRCVGGPGCTFQDTMRVTATLGPLPSLTAEPTICPGDSISLDASLSDPNGCTTGLEYQFSDGGTVLQPWSGSSTYGPLAPAATTTYTVEVRCGSCATTTQTTVTVEPRPIAEVRGITLVCVADTTTLDGGGSIGCPGAMEYRWLDAATPVCNWSTTPTCDVTPAVPTTYTLEVRCQGGICPATTTIAVDVAPRPVAAVSPDQNVCAPGPVQLDASTSNTTGCPGGPLYEWWQGATQVRAASPVATYAPPATAPGTFTYTVVVSCAGLPGCDDQVNVDVTVRDCSLAVRFDSVSATRVDRGHVAIEWTTSSEIGSVLFAVERATSPSGPFTLIATTPALGGGTRYALTDEVESATAPLWYRVVEHTVDGRGDESAVVAVATAPGESPTGARRRARSRPR